MLSLRDRHEGIFVWVFFFFFSAAFMLFVPLNMLHVQAFPYAARLISPRVCVYAFVMHVCVCLLTVVTRTDDVILNVCGDAACEIRGVSANLPQVLVSRIPSVSH